MSVRLAQVVELLRSSDDDHRFVGLLLAPRFLALDAELVDSADDAQATASSGRRSGGGSSSAAEIMRILYRAMGFDFLRRLLNTDDDEGAYQDAALTVTLSFMRDEAFRHELELGSLCEPATRIVEAKAYGRAGAAQRSAARSVGLTRPVYVCVRVRAYVHVRAERRVAHACSRSSCCCGWRASARSPSRR